MYYATIFNQYISSTAKLLEATYIAIILYYGQPVFTEPQHSSGEHVTHLINDQSCIAGSVMKGLIWLD